MRAYIDVETSGMSRKKGARIVEIGAILVTEQFVEVASLSMLVNPGEESLEGEGAPGAFDVNGLGPELLREVTIAADAAKAFHEFVRPVLAEHFHAYNVQFDSRFMDIDPWNFSKDNWGECVMIAAKRAMGVGPFPKLQDAAMQLVDYEIAQTHRALDDARLAMRVHKAIVGVPSE